MTLDGLLRVMRLLSVGQFEVYVGCSLNVSQSGPGSHFTLFLLPAITAGIQSNASCSNEDKHYRYSAHRPIRLNAGAPSQQTQGRC